MKKFLIAIVLLILFFVTAISVYYFLQPTLADMKPELLAQISEYEQDLNLRKQKASCNNPKNAAEFECLYSATVALPIVAERHKMFQAYWMWIQEERNCDRKTGVCTMMAVYPEPEEMRKSLDDYMQFCSKNPKKCEGK